MAAPANLAQGLPDDNGAFCTSCGAAHAPQARFCASCGTASQQSDQTTELIPTNAQPQARHLHAVADPVAQPFTLAPAPIAAGAPVRLTSRSLMLIAGVAGVLAVACIVTVLVLASRGDSATETAAAGGFAGGLVDLIGGMMPLDKECVYECFAAV